jgi:hypothetical protein
MYQTLFALLFVFISFNVNADDKSSGCGLGWKVNSRNSLSGTSTRGTTNPYGVSSMFGTSFGTSGCDRHSIVKNEKRALHFAEVNYDSLILEMALGSGEFLDGFAMTLGCSSQAFSSAMQRNFKQIMTAGDSAAPMLNQVNKIIRADSTLSFQCVNTTI